MENIVAKYCGNETVMVNLGDYIDANDNVNIGIVVDNISTDNLNLLKQIISKRILVRSVILVPSYSKWARMGEMAIHRVIGALPIRAQQYIQDDMLIVDIKSNQQQNKIITNLQS